MLNSSTTQAVVSVSRDIPQTSESAGTIIDLPRVHWNKELQQLRADVNRAVADQNDYIDRYLTDFQLRMSVRFADMKRQLVVRNRWIAISVAVLTGTLGFVLTHIH